MEVRTRHERRIAAPPEELAELIADFDLFWPTEIGPAPRALGDGFYEAGVMLWEEVDRPGAARAWRVVRPDEFQAEHWFELEVVEGGTILRHRIEGRAVGSFETLWRERIAPLHDRELEAILDNVEAAVASRT